MPTVVTDYTVKLVKLPVNGVSVPIFAVYADFSTIDATDHEFTITADVYNTVRAMWSTIPVGVTVQRRGTAQNVLNDMVEYTEVKEGLKFESYFTASDQRYFNIVYTAFTDNGSRSIFQTTPGYYLASNNRQRISTGLLLVDTASGKIVTVGGRTWGMLTSDTIAATAENPNPNGVAVVNGLPVAIAPTSWVYDVTEDTTFSAVTPYLTTVDGVEPYESVDPYDPGGNTEPGGGDGDFDDTTEPIEFSPDPIISAVDTGFITLFNPSLTQLNNLANYMWGSLFDLENFKKLFANPMDAILGLSIVPVAVPNGGTTNVRVGNIDTGIAMTKAGSQYVNVDCGTLNIKEYWGAYLDYSPYTKAEIFLPFIGTHPLDIDDIMKKAVHVKYKVDILSGACIAQIKCGDSVLYSYAGQCAATIPVTGRDWTNVVGSALSIVGNVAGAAVTGGMLAPMAAANVAQAVTNMGKPNIQKSGSVAGMAGIMGIQTPYIMLTRPRQAVPKNQNHYTGYPSFITTKLDRCSGYTEVEAVHLEGVPGTTEELAEIERLLQSGVIF